MTRRPVSERFFASCASLGVVGALVACLTVTSATADVDRGSSIADDSELPFNFLSRFGLEGERLALEGGGEPRRRALRRLISLSRSTPKQTANLLDEWLAESPKLTDLESWFLVRTLANLHNEPAARRRLASALGGEDWGIDPASPYASAIPKTAALALAKSNDFETTALLGAWLRRPSERAHWSRAALLAHPPRDVSPLLTASGPATPLLMETLGDLGDATAIPFLRRVVKRATADVQAAAAIALAKLNVRETQDLAALWLGRSDAHADLTHASAWILFQFQHPRRGAALEELLRRRPKAGLDLAEEFTPDIHLTALVQYLDKLPDHEDKRRALRVLARVGAEAVAPLIEVMRANARLRWEAAAALGEVDSPIAGHELWNLLKEGQFAGPALSALVVRAMLHPNTEQKDALVSELRRRTKSGDRVTRDVALAGLAVLNEAQARVFLASDDDAQRLAAILASSVHSDDYLRVCIDRLHSLARHGTSDTLRLTPKTLESAAVLSFASSTNSLSPRLLRLLAETQYPIADVALWHGWLRGDATLGFAPPPMTAAPALRAAHALSLGAGEVSPGQVAKATMDLQSESDAEVRAALVTALQRHQKLPTVAETLHWHAQYDPEPWVRTVAALGDWPGVQLRAFWISPPPSAANKYWVRITHPNRPPFAVLLNYSHPAVLFVHHLRQVARGEIPYPTTPDSALNAGVQDYLRVETLEPLPTPPSP